MKKCTWFSLFLVVKLAFGAGEIFEANLQLDNHRFDTDVIRRMEEVNLTDCAVYCSDRVDCMSVQYSLTTKACRLFSTVFLSPIDGDPEIGWRYYQKTGGKTFILSTFSPFLSILRVAVIWLRYCRYGVKLYSINQLINQLINNM